MAEKPPEITNALDPLVGKLESLGVDTEQALTVTATMRAQYSGPLPPAEQFQIYEKTVPGAGREIINYMNNEQAHRHKMDAESLALMKRETLRGQNMGFAIIIIVLILATIAAFFGHEVFATILLGGVVLSVVGRFIDGRFLRHQDGQ